MLTAKDKMKSVSPREAKLKVNGVVLSPERIAEDLTAMAISVPAGVIAGVAKAILAAVKKTGITIEVEK